MKIVILFILALPLASTKDCPLQAFLPDTDLDINQDVQLIAEEHADNKKQCQKLCCDRDKCTVAIFSKDNTTCSLYSCKQCEMKHVAGKSFSLISKEESTQNNIAGSGPSKEAVTPVQTAPPSGTPPSETGTRRKNSAATNTPTTSKLISSMDPSQEKASTPVSPGNRSSTPDSSPPTSGMAATVGAGQESGQGVTTSKTNSTAVSPDNTTSTKVPSTISLPDKQTGVQENSPNTVQGQTTDGTSTASSQSTVASNGSPTTGQTTAASNESDSVWQSPTSSNTSTPTGQPTSASNTSTSSGQSTTATNATTTAWQPTSSPNTSTPTGQSTSASNVTTTTGQSTSASNMPASTGQPTAASNVTTTAGQLTIASSTTSAVGQPNTTSNMSTTTGQPPSVPNSSVTETTTDLNTTNGHNASTSPGSISSSDGYGGLADEKERHLATMMPPALIAAFSCGVVFFFVVFVLVGKRFFEAWQRRNYSRMDYLINGLYN